MESAVIVDAVRTPMGARNGSLSGWHPAELAGAVLDALATRNGLDPALVDEVIMGCAMQVGAQAVNLGRTAVLAVGWPESVPATTVDRQCGSSMQAVHFAAQSVLAGAAEVVVAAGVEVMSLVPMGASVAVRDVGQPFPPSLHARYEAAGGLRPQGLAAELIADRLGLTRDALDAYALASQERAARAGAEGRFGAEMVEVAERILDREGHRVVDTGRPVTADGGVRPVSAAELAALKPAYQADGVVTAGNSAQLADGAAAVLIMSGTRAEALGLRPLARFRSFSVVGTDPLTMLTGAGPATTRALQRAELTAAELDVAEVHEAFAGVVLAWLADHPVDPARVNPNGGAIALGHPVGCSGARQIATLVHELDRIGGRFGLAAMADTGGTASALVLERE